MLHPLDRAEAARVRAATPDDGDRWAPEYPTDGDRISTRNFVEQCGDGHDPTPFGAYQIRRDGVAIGGLGFHRPPDEHGAVTIGYGVVPAARGQGYATEALRGMLALARDHGVRTVRGDTEQDNLASQRVMLAAGMRHVRDDAKLRYYELTWA